MVGPDVIVTAGHCGETNAEIQQTAYVFGFRVGTAVTKASVFIDKFPDDIG